MFSANESSRTRSIAATLYPTAQDGTPLLQSTARPSFTFAPTQSGMTIEQESAYWASSAEEESMAHSKMNYDNWYEPTQGGGIHNPHSMDVPAANPIGLGSPRPAHKPSPQSYQTANAPPPVHDTSFFHSDFDAVLDEWFNTEMVQKSILEQQSHTTTMSAHSFTANDLAGETPRAVPVNPYSGQYNAPGQTAPSREPLLPASNEIVWTTVPHKLGNDALLLQGFDYPKTEASNSSSWDDAQRAPTPEAGVDSTSDHSVSYLGSWTDSDTDMNADPYTWDDGRPAPSPKVIWGCNTPSANLPMPWGSS